MINIKANNTNKESFMENYYKTSKNIGNILNSYEFQRQFIKSKKKYKLMKKIKERKILLEKENPSEYKNLTENINNNLNYNNLGGINNSIQTFKAKKVLTYPNHKKNMMSVIKEEENINNNDFDISTIIQKNKSKNLKRERTSKYMRKTLFQQIKNEGLYDDSEEEIEDDSLDTENENMNNNILTNRKKEGFEFSLLSDGLKNLNNLNRIKNNGNINDNNYANNDKNSDLSLYSIKTDYKIEDNNINNNEYYENNNNFENY